MLFLPYAAVVLQSDDTLAYEHVLHPLPSSALAAGHLRCPSSGISCARKDSPS
jgi:hypothetical protein